MKTGHNFSLGFLHKFINLIPSVEKELSASEIIAGEPMTEQQEIFCRQAHQSQPSTPPRAPTGASHVIPGPLTAPIRAHPATGGTNQSSRDKPAPQGSKLGHFIKFLLERDCPRAPKGAGTIAIPHVGFDVPSPGLTSASGNRGGRGCKGMGRGGLSVSVRV